MTQDLSLLEAAKQALCFVEYLNDEEFNDWLGQALPEADWRAWQEARILVQRKLSTSLKPYLNLSLCSK